MGNIVAGFFAKSSGLPIRHIVTGCNVNDITQRVFNTGKYERAPSVFKNCAEALNIQSPYNFERILFWYCQKVMGDTAKASAATRLMYEELEKTDKFTVPTKVHAAMKELFCFSSRVEDTEIKGVIKEFHNDYSYLADPHTAVGLVAARKYFAKRDELKHTDVPTIVLATAHFCKFQEVVTEAIGPSAWEEAFKADKSVKGVKSEKGNKVDKLLQLANALMKLPEKPYALTLRQISGVASPVARLKASQAKWFPQIEQMLDAFAADSPVMAEGNNETTMQRSL